jgi:hypothetical protein
MDQTDKFLHFTATGWTAFGSIVSAISILALSIFNWLYLIAARRAAIAAEKSATAAEQQATAAQTSLELLRDQLALTQRPFIAIYSEYCEEINARLVYAHNQGNGPALDLEASLVYDPDRHQDAYGVGCLPIDGKFQFLIGERSNKLMCVVFWYKSITGEEWTTTIGMVAGSSAVTKVEAGHQHRDGRYSRIVEGFVDSWR